MIWSFSHILSHTMGKIKHTLHADLGKSNVSQGVQPEVEVVCVLEMKSLRLTKKEIIV